MNRIRVFVCSAALLIGLAAGVQAKEVFTWEQTLPNYTIAFQTIGVIPDGYSMSGLGWVGLAALEKVGELTQEIKYCVWASCGYQLFQDIRSSQSQYVWLRARLDPNDEEQFYDGSLARLRLVMSDGTQVAPTAIFATPVSQVVAMENKGATATVYSLLANGVQQSDVRYSDFPYESSSGKVSYFVYIKFLRSSVNPENIKTVEFLDEHKDVPAATAASAAGR